MLGSQVAGCVKNINYDHNRNVLYPVKIMSKFTMMFHFDLRRAFPVGAIVAMSYFPYMESIQKGIPKFINFPVGNHSFNSSIM